MKKILLTILLSFAIISSVSATKYRISKVTYEIKGMTREYPLRKAVEISNKKIFEDYESLNSYIDDIKQKFKNERVLEDSIVTMSYGEMEGDDIQLVQLNVFTIDSKHFLAIPYPKYDSNNGFIFKLKIQDSNFLGSMNTLSSDINLGYSSGSDIINKNGKEETINDGYHIGVSFAFNYPFKLGVLDSSWVNDFSVDYCVGNSTPEFKITSGFTFELPFNDFSLKLDLRSSVTRNIEYEKKYDDGLYLTQYVMLSLPVKIAKIDKWGYVLYTPYASYSWNYDSDGISKNNIDLSGPVISIGHSLGTARINWLGNFREGASFSIGQALGYNYQMDYYVPTVTGQLAVYKAFKYFGITSRLMGFAYLNGNQKIGEYIRGVKNDQKGVSAKIAKINSISPLDYELTKDYSTVEVHRVATAIAMNIDLPIHILTTDWRGFTGFVFGEDSKMANRLSWMRYFDFELQVAPFFDFALTKNPITGTVFDIKDGWYGGGLEVLVFPKKWRSLVVRGSLGVDLGRTVMNKIKSNLVDTSWRKKTSKYELYIGIGLHY